MPAKSSQKVESNDHINKHIPKVISLSTIKPQGMQVEIDGKLYETVPPAWWGAEHARSVREYMFVINRYETMLQDEDGPNPSDTDLQQYKHALREFTKVVIPDVPIEIVERLPDGECQVLMSMFLGELRARRQPQPTDQNTTTTTGLTP